MTKEKVYRICTKCEIAHIENCGSCFGFGIYANTEENVPVSAGEAHDGNITRPTLPCPECGSTYLGLPGKYSEDRLVRFI